MFHRVVAGPGGDRAAQLATPPLPSAEALGLPPRMSLQSLEDLDGVWHSDCGTMAISEGQVRDCHGESAPLALSVGGHLELQFAGTLWRSQFVDPDCICWEGEGGTWTRVGPPTSSITGWRGPSAGGLGSQVFCENRQKDHNSRHAAQHHVSQPLQHKPQQMQQQPQHMQHFQQLQAVQHELHQLQQQLHVPHQHLHQQQWQAGALLHQVRPPNVGQLEAKLSNLVNVVAGLQGQCDQLLEARRAAAARKAREQPAPEPRPVMPQQQLMPEVVWAGHPGSQGEVIDHRHVMERRLQAMRDQIGMANPTGWLQHPPPRLP